MSSAATDSLRAQPGGPETQPFNGTTQPNLGQPETPAGPASPQPSPTASPTAFGCPRDFLAHRLVYVVVSSRAGGLCIGVNMNPDKRCNFDCAYCEVDRRTPGAAGDIDPQELARELTATLDYVHSGRIQERSRFANLPGDLRPLRHVALSGDGEPTLCPNYADALHSVVHVRALGTFPFFKLVLITNASGLDRPEVENGFQYFTRSDEVWAKLDAGTQTYMDRVNRTQVPLTKILENILRLSRQHPVVIQSLFPAIDGQGPSLEEIDAYAHRLRELKQAGAQISQVQIYSATRPSPCSDCSHLPLRSLSAIAQRVREVAGLRAEVS
jgi:wyosine [tRNA(Phe)-imidazoG37] synthetase (radical SAM superfamily)